MVGVSPNNYAQYITWNAQSFDFISLGASTLNIIYSKYLYINSAGTLLSSDSPTDNTTTVLLGKAVAQGIAGGDYGVTYIQNIQRNANNTATLIDRTLRFGIQSIVDSGLITTLDSGSTVSPCNFFFDVSNGDFYFSTYNFTLSLDTFKINMMQVWRAGSGLFTGKISNYVLGYESGISNPQWDSLGNGTLSNIDSGKYVKHALYYTGGGAPGEFVFVYGQQEFNDLPTAQTGGIPPTPSFLGPSVVSICGIIVGATDTTLDATRFRDIRPTLAYHSSGVTATADHNSLLNLTVGDVHTQYLPINGSRSFTGNLNMGTGNITNSGTYNTVTVEAHASRHLPGGADPLIVGTPTTIGTSNSIGIVNNFSRSDHIHAHGAQTDGTLHAIVTEAVAGFMSATDKTKLDNATSLATASTLVSRDTNSDTTIKDLILRDPATSTVGTLIMNDSTNTKQLTLSTPTALTSSWALKLPTSAGSNLQLLQTDGNGNTSWITSTGYVDPLTTNGDMVVRAGGITTRIGVGTQVQILKVISSAPTWDQSVNPRLEAPFLDDFCGSVTPFGDFQWSVNSNGAGSTVASVGISTFANESLNGIISLQTGTNEQDDIFYIKLKMPKD